MSFVKGGKALTKCGITLPSSKTVAFRTDCPDCQVKGAWPDKGQQKEFAK